jgi:hypothetical protein
MKLPERLGLRSWFVRSAIGCSQLRQGEKGEGSRTPCLLHLRKISVERRWPETIKRQRPKGHMHDAARMTGEHECGYTQSSCRGRPDAPYGSYRRHSTSFIRPFGSVSARRMHFGPAHRPRHSAKQSQSASQDRPRQSCMRWQGGVVVSEKKKFSKARVHHLRRVKTVQRCQSVRECLDLLQAEVAQSCD